MTGNDAGSKTCGTEAPSNEPESASVTEISKKKRRPTPIIFVILISMDRPSPKDQSLAPEVKAVAGTLSGTLLASSCIPFAFEVSLTLPIPRLPAHVRLGDETVEFAVYVVDRTNSDRLGHTEPVFDGRGPVDQCLLLPLWCSAYK